MGLIIGIIKGYYKIIIAIILIYLAVTVFGGVPVVCMGLLAIALLLLLSYIFSYVRWFWTPFRCLHRFLTATTDESKNVHYDVLTNKRYVKYVNKVQLIVFGIFGNILYYAIMLSLFFIAVSFRPYSEGYILKQASYEVGDQVVCKIDKDKAIATIVSVEGSESFPEYKVTTEKGTSAVVEYDNVRGEYVDNCTNVVEIFFKSSVNWVHYMKEAYFE